MPHDQSKRYLQGALILTFATLIVKILSALYRVPFQNIVGDIGFYIYQQVYPLYGVALILATSGFPVIISRITAESAGGNPRHLQQNIQAAFYTITIIGFVCFSIIFVGAHWIALMMGDSLLTPSIRTVSFLFLFLPFISVWRGYFQGMGNMVPTALSQVVEQLIRVVFILLFSYILVVQGHSLYVAGLGAFIGSLIGIFAGFVILLIYAYKAKMFDSLFSLELSFKKFWSMAQIVLIHGTAVCFSGMLLILFQLVDSFSIYSILVKTGMESDQAKIVKGVFDRGQPLIQLGTVTATSFALALVPLIAKASKENNMKMAHKRIFHSLNISVVIGLGAAIGLALIIRPTNIMLFSNADGSNVLFVLALSIFFSTINIVITAILQGMGHFFTPVKYILFGLLFKMICNYALVPIFGTLGAAIATLLGLAIIAFLLCKKLNDRFQLIKQLIHLIPKLLVAVLSMIILVKLWLLFLSIFDLDHRWGQSMVALTSVVFGGLIYLWVIIRTKVLSAEEMSFLPFGNRIHTMLTDNKK